MTVTTVRRDGRDGERRLNPRPTDTSQLVEPLRQRCRGDHHKSGCAHLGNDPTRLRCRGDKHKPRCRHLNPPPKRRPGRPKRNKRREAALRREAAKRAARERLAPVVVRSSAAPGAPQTTGPAFAVPKYSTRTDRDHSPHEMDGRNGPYPVGDGPDPRPPCDRCHSGPAEVIVTGPPKEWLCEICLSTRAPRTRRKRHEGRQPRQEAGVGS